MVRFAPVSDTRSLFGFHAVNARLRQRPESVRALHVAGARRDARMRDLVARAEAARCPIHATDDDRLAQLAGTDRHQGVVAIVDAASPRVTLDEVLESLTEPALLLILDGVTDPHNLGACLRNADAFGAHAVIVPKDRAVGLNATAAKAASGAADTIPLITVTNLARALRDLKSKGVWILGADAGAESLFDADVSGPVAWVLGAEGAGLRRLTRELCDRIVGVPLFGAVESLNVAVASGICLYATRRARYVPR
jgi:23S rRNA (guanosine2251-2'-O)-methyltransferase